MVDTADDRLGLLRNASDCRASLAFEGLEAGALVAVLRVRLLIASECGCTVVAEADHNAA